MHALISNPALAVLAIVAFTAFAIPATPPWLAFPALLLTFVFLSLISFRMFRTHRELNRHIERHSPQAQAIDNIRALGDIENRTSP